MSELFTGASLEAAATAASAAPAAATSDATPNDAAAGVLPAAEAAATGQAATDGTAANPTDPATTPKDTKQGPVPFDVHHTALQNARTKVADEIKAQYAWAEQIPTEHRQTVGSFYALLDSEPVSAIETLIRTAAADAQHAPKLRSLFGRLLGNRAPATSQPAQTATPNNGGAAIPDPDFTDGAGNDFYSAKAMRQALDALERRIDAKYAQKYGPIEQDYRTRTQREAAARAEAHARQEAATWAERRYAQASKWPHFETFKADIGAAMAADADLDVGDAYIQVVVPQLSMQERQAFAASQTDKVSASAINPANPASATNGRPKSFAEGFAQVPAAAWGS